jgi:hypothetical protein
VKIDAKRILQIVKKHANVGAMGSEILVDELLLPAMQAVVASTSTDFDDKLLEKYYPVIEESFKKKVAEVIEELLAKI